MKRIIVVTIVWIGGFLSPAMGSTKKQIAGRPIRLAILDNLKKEKLASDRYFQGHREGIELAVQEARKMGIHFEVKEFLFGKEPLAVLDAAREAEGWKPDLVIGPRSSDLFLLIKERFQDTLVLSPLATASAVADMPKNFYSLTPPNQYAVKALVNLTKRDFPGKAVFPVVEVDCKYCMDFSEQFVSEGQAANIKIRAEKRFFLEKNVETADVGELTKGYQAGDVILLPNGSYTSGIMMKRITNQLKQPTLIFLGADGWGDWSVGYVGKYPAEYKYHGLRVTPWSLDSSERMVSSFKERYKTAKGNEPAANIILIAYTTLKSVLEAVKDEKRNGEWRPLILKSYLKERARDQNFFRPKNYAIYQVSQKGETYAGQVPALTSEVKNGH